MSVWTLHRYTSNARLNTNHAGVNFLAVLGSQRIPQRQVRDPAEHCATLNLSLSLPQGLSGFAKSTQTLTAFRISRIPGTRGILGCASGVRLFRAGVDSQADDS